MSIFVRCKSRLNSIALVAAACSTCCRLCDEELHVTLPATSATHRSQILQRASLSDECAVAKLTQAPMRDFVPSKNQNSQEIAVRETSQQRRISYALSAQSFASIVQSGHTRCRRQESVARTWRAYVGVVSDEFIVERHAHNASHRTQRLNARAT